MTRTRLIPILGAVVAVGALALPAGAAARAIKGTVVHHNARAHSFVVADRAGRLTAVHARHAPRLGRVVTVRARRLANGTFKARSIRAHGVRRHARIRGTVTYASRARGVFVVSTRGASLLVHRRTALRAAAAGDSVPAVGTDVTVDASIDDQGDIEGDDVQEHGQAQGTVELEGVVASVNADARTLTLSADDDQQSGATITVSLPAGFDPAAYHPGDEVELVATLNADGTYTAVGSSGDDNAQQADDNSDDQGDDSGHHGSGDHQSSGDQGSGGDGGSNQED